jgi:hypothetical protein
MRRIALATALSLALSLPAAAETLFCAPVALAELIGEAGPLTISAADPELGNPTVFWLDTETGQVLEHFEGGSDFITDEISLVGGTERSVYEGVDESQDEIYRIDMSVVFHPYQRSVNAALTQIGVCVPSAMGQLPDEDVAPIWPFSYQAEGKRK